MKRITNNMPLRLVRRSPWGTKPWRCLLAEGGNESGQSLILALLIMFLLVFLGGVFVAIIARNLSRAQRSSETLSADYLAEAGIRYAGDQLTYSEDGADWRPVPVFPAVVEYWETHPGCTLQDVITDVPAADKPNDRDPDYMWLMQGFSRFTYGKGRFLLRVTYNPRPHDPTSKYIKIEAIGRMGIVDESDPTTWQTRQSSRLRAERVAYKAIGITDYSRFITNKDRRPGQFSLGTPGADYVTQYGVWDRDPPNGNGDDVVDFKVNKDATDPTNTTVTSEAYGGSIRVNGDLLWHGRNDVWVDPFRNEGVEVAGEIQFDITGGSPAATQVMVDKLPTYKSSDLSFNTWPITPTGGEPPDAGVYRDGRTGTDENGYPRNIVRLDPPLIDVRGPAGGVSRYRELTRNSGEWLPPDANHAEWFNTGFYGWGAGLYINNPNDKQSESELGTLKNEWMTPGSSQYWVGPYYIPPGVLIVLTPHDLNDDGSPDMILIRSDATPSNPVWYDRDGNPLTTTGGQIIMPYPRNGVIFVEGNVRIKGTLPPSTQLTVVSGGTIYVEGSILRYPYDEDSNLLLPTDPRNSAIALLATDYVCVNTTQFFGPMSEGPLPVNWRPDLSSFIASVSQPLYLNWAFGADANFTYVDSGGNLLPVCLYLRHTAEGGDVPSYMNLSINQFGVGAQAVGSSNPFWGLYRFGLNWSSIPAADSIYVYPLGDLNAASAVFPTPPGPDKYAQAIAEQKWPMWEHNTFTLNAGLGEYTFFTDPGVYNSVGFHLDQNYTQGDYLLSRMAVQPCDIRIEALLYAQNGSFFVIPGDWFNPDTNDISIADGAPDGDSVNPANGIPDYRDRTMKRQRIDDRWSFYRQPLDCRITIFGAVNENVPASIAEVSAWMDKWGWIPPVHGCSTDTKQQTTHYRSPLDPNDSEDDVLRGGEPMQPIKQRGLTIVYDRSLSYPKYPDPEHPTDQMYDLPVRKDAYYRRLPLLPKLPVSPETLYFGRPS